MKKYIRNPRKKPLYDMSKETQKDDKIKEAKEAKGK